MKPHFKRGLIQVDASEGRWRAFGVLSLLVTVLSACSDSVYTRLPITGNVKETIVVANPGQGTGPRPWNPNTGGGNTPPPSSGEPIVTFTQDEMKADGTLQFKFEVNSKSKIKSTVCEQMTQSGEEVTVKVLQGCKVKKINTVVVPKDGRKVWVRVTAKDEMGRVGSEVTKERSIDPITGKEQVNLNDLSATYLAGPDDGGLFSYEFDFNVSGDPTSVVCEVMGTSQSFGPLESCTAPVPLTGLSAGSYSFKVTATKGETVVSESLSFEIEGEVDASDPPLEGDEGANSFRVALTSVGGNQAAVIQVIQDSLGIDPLYAWIYATASLPVMVRFDSTEAEAKAMVDSLTAAGASARVVRPEDENTDFYTPEYTCTPGTNYRVMLNSVGNNSDAVIQVLRLDLRVWEYVAHELVNGALPIEVKSLISKVDADNLVSKLVYVGATASVSTVDSCVPDPNATDTPPGEGVCAVPDVYSVELTAVGPNKIQVIDVVGDQLDLGLRATKAKVESAPAILKSCMSKDAAGKLEAALIAAGATVLVTPALESSDGGGGSNPGGDSGDGGTPQVSPTCTISGNPGYETSASPVFTISCSTQVNTKKACSLDGGTPRSCSTSYAPTSVASGSHTFKLEYSYSKDGSNVKDSVNHTWTATIAGTGGTGGGGGTTTPPPIISVPQKIVDPATKQATIVFSITNHDPATVVCSHESGPSGGPTLKPQDPLPCKSPYISQTQLSPGTYKLKISASGPGGSTSVTPDFTIQADATTPPKVVSMSAPAGVYGPGMTVPISVMFDYAVQIVGSGAVRFLLSNNGTAELQRVDGLDPKKAIFNYVVKSSDTSLTSITTTGSLVTVGARKLVSVSKVNGTPLDAETGLNNLVISGLTVDTKAPVVNAVTGTPMAGGTAYSKGALIPIQVVFNEEVQVTGAGVHGASQNPILALKTSVDAGGNMIKSGNALWQPSTSFSKNLNFSYTVLSGDRTDKLDYLSKSALTKGTTVKIRDVAGNEADVTLPEPGNRNSLADRSSIEINAVEASSGSLCRFADNLADHVWVMSPTFNFSRQDCVLEEMCYANGLKVDCSSPYSMGVGANTFQLKLNNQVFDTLTLGYDPLKPRISFRSTQITGKKAIIDAQAWAVGPVKVHCTLYEGTTKKREDKDCQPEMLDLYRWSGLIRGPVAGKEYKFQIKAVSSVNFQESTVNEIKWTPRVNEDSGTLQCRMVSTDQPGTAGIYFIGTEDKLRGSQVVNNSSTRVNWRVDCEKKTATSGAAIIPKDLIYTQSIGTSPRTSSWADVTGQDLIYLFVDQGVTLSTKALATSYSASITGVSAVPESANWAASNYQKDRILQSQLIQYGIFKDSVKPKIAGVKLERTKDGKANVRFVAWDPPHATQATEVVTPESYLKKVCLIRKHEGQSRTPVFQGVCSEAASVELIEGGKYSLEVTITDLAGNMVSVTN